MIDDDNLILQNLLHILALSLHKCAVITPYFKHCMCIGISFLQYTCADYAFQIAYYAFEQCFKIFPSMP